MKNPFKKVALWVLYWIFIGVLFVVYGIACLYFPHDAKYPQIRQKKAA